MSPLRQRPDPRDERFLGWVARVEQLVRERLGIALDDLPGLPLRAGFDCGDTPAEFFAGCIEDQAEEREAWRGCLQPPG